MAVARVTTTLKDRHDLLFKEFDFSGGGCLFYALDRRFVLGIANGA
jgi:hypothetical protein